ncbi:MAG: hypothetical protein KF893_07480 [Caldilineaceae bacterium]|nr:hypothetical protein [Caldilineaceae bacterium]
MKLYSYSWRLLCVLALVLLLNAQQPASPLQAQASGITSPAPGSAVSGAVTVTGTAANDSFQRYELYYKQEPNGDDAYIYFDGSTRAVVNGQLGIWQTSDLPAGIYSLRLRVVRPDGNYSEHFAPNLSVNQQAPIVEEPTPTPEFSETQSNDVTAGGPTPTPIPIDTPTPLPQPTPAIVNVEQPNLGVTPAPEPTPTEALVAMGNTGSTGNTGSATGTGGAAGNTTQVGANFTGELGEALALDRLRERFMSGVRYSAGIFLILLAIFVGKRLLEWTLSRAG